LRDFSLLVCKKRETVHKYNDLSASSLHVQNNFFVINQTCVNPFLHVSIHFQKKKGIFPLEKKLLTFSEGFGHVVFLNVCHCSKEGQIVQQPTL
jgi:hypothetical protein